MDGHELLDRIVGLRRAHALLRRRLSPQREVFAALARPGQALVKDQTAIYFRDVVDHSVRLTEEIDTGRDLLASAMDAYLSHSNNRLSAVTARLTLIATIFLPLNFIAGFFGMNLEILPPQIAIPLVLLAIVAVPVAMWRSSGGSAGCSACEGACTSAGSGTTSAPPPGGCTRTSPSSSSRPRIAISTSRKRRMTVRVRGEVLRHRVDGVAGRRDDPGGGGTSPAARERRRQEQLVAEVPVHRRAALEVRAEAAHRLVRDLLGRPLARAHRAVPGAGALERRDDEDVAAPRERAPAGHALRLRGDAGLAQPADRARRLPLGDLEAEAAHHRDHLDVLQRAAVAEIERRHRVAPARRAR